MGQYLNEDHIPVMQDVEYLHELRIMLRNYINSYMDETVGVDYLIDNWTIKSDYLRVYWYDNDNDEEKYLQVDTQKFLEWCKWCKTR